MPPPRPAFMLKSTVATYSPALINRMSIVLKRARGTNPPITEPALRTSAARGPTSSWQYGQIRSSMVMNARQCGHMRRESICIHHTTSVFSARNFRLQDEHTAGKGVISKCYELENHPGRAAFVAAAPDERRRGRSAPPRHAARQTG